MWASSLVATVVPDWPTYWLGVEFGPLGVLLDSSMYKNYLFLQLSLLSTLTTSPEEWMFTSLIISRCVLVSTGQALQLFLSLPLLHLLPPSGSPWQWLWCS